MPIIYILTCILPLAALPLVLFFALTSKKRETKFVFTIALIIPICFILYQMTPSETTDLSRYYALMESYSDMNVSTFVNNHLHDVEPLSNLLFYSFSKLGDYHLLTVFTGLISYLIIFYVIFDYQKTKQLSNTKLNIVLIYTLATFLIVYNITGIRFCLARLLFFLAIYLDYYKNKRNLSVIILYTVPILLHQSAILLIAIRLLSIFNNKKVNFTKIAVSTIILLSPLLVSNILSNIIPNNTFIIEIYDKANKYIGYGNSFSNIYKLQLTFALYMLICSLLFWIKDTKANNSYKTFFILTVIVSLGYMLSETISTRFIGVLCTMSIIMQMDIIKNKHGKNLVLYAATLLPFIIMYSIFQIIQLVNDGTYENLLFNPKFTAIALIATTMIIFFYSIKNEMGRTRKCKT